METTVQFTVFGKQATQGSKKVVPIMRGGKPVMKDGRALTRAIEDNPKTAVWRQEVAAAARKAHDGPLLIGPLRLRLEFYRPRPAAHFGTGRNAGVLKRSSPQYPTTRPDTVKLTRAVEDALTGVLWRDDSQVVVHELRKQFGEFFSVRVFVEELP